MKKYDVVMLGHFSKDIIITKNGVSFSKGGATYYGSIILRRLGLRVAVITKLSREDFHLLDELRKLNIDVYVSESSETTSIENIYYTADMDRRITRLKHIANPFDENDIPKDISWNVFMVTPLIAGEVDLELLKYIRERTKGMLALDVQGFVRVPRGDNLVLEDLKEKATILKLVDVLKMDDAEAEVLTRQKDLTKAVLEIAKYGVKEIVLTHSKGVLIYANGKFYEGIWTAKSLKGRTGRGDTCFASYIGIRLEASPEIACKLAAQITSRKIEIPGPYYGPLPLIGHIITKKRN